MVTAEQKQQDILLNIQKITMIMPSSIINYNIQIHLAHVGALRDRYFCRWSKTKHYNIEAEHCTNRCERSIYTSLAQFLTSPVSTLFWRASCTSP